MVNFGNSNELRSWLGTQPRHVGIALAARSALRVLPMIGLPSAGALTLADAKIVQAHFRALSVAWIAFGQYAGDRRLRITARAGLAAAVSLPIGTFSTSLAASAARRSAAEAVRTLVNAGQRSTDALAAAISEAFSAEAEFPEARGVWALAGDVEFLAGRDASLLSDVPLWLNRPPTWAVPRWRDLKELLSDAEENWQVWTIWYDDRLDGRVNSLEREVAYVDVRDDLWGQAPAVVNADIVRRIEEYEPPPQPIPPQDIQVEVQPSDIPEGARGPVFSDSRDVEQWLADKSPEWAIVIAARSALRSIPALASESRTTSGGVSAAESTIILPMFRAVCAAWVAANNPRWVNNSDLVQGIVAAEQAIFAPKVSTRTNSIVAVQAAISTFATALDGPGGYGAGLAVAAAANAAFSLESVGDRDAAAKEVWSVAADDARILEHPIAPHDLAHHPLWPGGVPRWSVQSWRQLEHELLSLNNDWEVWTKWFTDRLNGGGPVHQPPEIARVIIAEEIWQQGPRAVNAEIARLIAQFTWPSGAASAEIDQLLTQSEPRRDSEQRAEAFQTWDFFLSYSSDDGEFALWLEDLLSAVGFSVFSQFNEMPPGSNFVNEMQRGLSRAIRFIALLSPSYVRSDQCQAEWSAVFNVDPGGKKRKLVPFLIKPAELPPLAKQIVYKQLVGLSAPDAAKAVLETVGYHGSVPTIPTRWPGGAAIDQMTAATGGVYDVAPGADLRLERVPALVAGPNDTAFTPQQLFANAAAVVADFFAFTKMDVGNFRCSQRLRERAAKLYQASSTEFFAADPLALNSRLVWVLRMMALDRHDGLIPPNDEFEFHQRDLYGVYNQLERIFPKLKSYRRMIARDRFEPPSADTEEAISSIYRSFGDPNISENAFSPSLSQELKQAGESIEEVKEATIDQRSDISVESHTDAATRTLAVWSWLSNAQDRLVKSGKKAEDVANVIERYEKLYHTLSPLMVRYMGYLVKWFF